MKEIIYVDDFAERLGISPNAVRLRYQRRSLSMPNPLPKDRTGGKLAWRMIDFERWLDQLDRRIAR
jgi:hypothetical protein